MAIDNNVPVEEQLSPEEIKARKEELTAFYKEGIKHLKPQLEYETLLNKYRRAKSKKNASYYVFS